MSRDPPRASAGSPARQDCGRLASRSGRGHTSVVLSHLVRGDLLQQSQETNTPYAGDGAGVRE